MEQPETPSTQPEPPPGQPEPVVGLPPRKHTAWLEAVAVVALLAMVGGTAWWLGAHHSKTTVATKSSTASATHSSTHQETPKISGLSLDAAKDYGNKYSNGILPVGDGKYSSTAAQKGSIYTCRTYASNLSSTAGGAGTRGPWFTNNNTEYDLSKKAHVQGSVMWQASFTNTVAGSTRSIVTNDLPVHPTGVFPIAASDPAYSYDRNPNNIKGQSLTFALSANPAYGSPSCMGGQSGIMLSGVALFNAFDAGGRDAGAWEVQDSCGGHPEKEGEYHYHTLSSCITDTSVHSVIGFALDGFPITGPKVGTNNLLTTKDLDECHGLTSQITLDGKPVTMYHYVMTQDFPYSVSCFRGTAIQPPGMPAGGSGMSGPPAKPAS